MLGGVRRPLRDTLRDHVAEAHVVGGAGFGVGAGKREQLLDEACEPLHLDDRRF